MSRSLDDLQRLAREAMAAGWLGAAEHHRRLSLGAALHAFGEESLEYAGALHDAAQLYHALLRFEEGAELAKAAAITRYRILGDHPLVARACYTAGLLLRDNGQHDLAVRYFRDAYRMFMTAHGLADGDTVDAMRCMLTAAWKAGEATAEEDLEAQIPILRRMASHDNPILFAYLTDLAGLLDAKGDAAGSRRSALEAIDQLGTLGDGSDVPLQPYFEDLTALLQRQGDLGAALLPLERAVRADDRFIQQAVATRDAPQRRAYLRRLSAGVSRFIRLMLAAGVTDGPLVECALHFVVNRKGLLAHAEMAHNDRRLREALPELAPLLDRVHETWRRLAEVEAEGGPDGWRKALRARSELRHELRLLNLDVEAEAAARGHRSAPVQALTAATIAAALPGRSVLVDIFAVTEADQDAGRAPVGPLLENDAWIVRDPPAVRYVAFVMHAGEPAVRMVDLGDAAAIDRYAYSYLVAMNQGMPAVVPREVEAELIDGPEEMLGRELRKRLFDPLMPSLRQSELVLFAPDGVTCRVPFAALPDGDDGRLVDGWTFGYVTSARMLAAFGRVAAWKEPPVLIGDPDYDLVKPGTPRPAAPDAEGFPMFHFARLDKTADEAWALAKILGGRVITGRKASEAALQTCRSPAVLHLATHGYYVRPFSQGIHVIGNWRAEGFGLLARGEVLGRVEMPLLRSGLVLAGVNAWTRGEPLAQEFGDGLLDSREVAHLDLHGTELVVLSACSTALGDVMAGQGVAGLLHGLERAGAAAIVASLWQIPEEATVMLMGAFYEALLRGEPRVVALRDAQRRLRERGEPAWKWAAHQCYGNPARMRYRGGVAPQS